MRTRFVIILVFFALSLGYVLWHQWRIVPGGWPFRLSPCLRSCAAPSPLGSFPRSVTVLNLFFNLFTEYAFQRLVVYGKRVDNRKK